MIVHFLKKIQIISITYICQCKKTTPYGRYFYSLYRASWRQRKQHLPRFHRLPFFNGNRFRTFIRSGAIIGISIFIASITASVAPSSTISPDLHSIFQIDPACVIPPHSPLQEFQHFTIITTASKLSETYSARPASCQRRRSASKLACCTDLNAEIDA